MKTQFIGIAGASGVGKSTLCSMLQEKYPDQIGLIQLDDYFKKDHLVPQLRGHQNWDHPDALRLSQLYKDLLELQSGKGVLIDTKNEKLNPDYIHTEKRIAVEFQPRPIMLVEGFLSLYDVKIRELFTTSIWLNVDPAESWKRRVHFKNDEYFVDVLMPMYTEYVLPTKKFAEYIIDVTALSQDEVCIEVEGIVLDS